MATMTTQQPGPAVRTEWSAHYVQGIRAQGKYLEVAVDGVKAFENPDALAIIGSNVVASIGGNTHVRSIGGGLGLQVREISDDPLKLMVQEFNETGEGSMNMRDL